MCVKHMYVNVFLSLSFSLSFFLEVSLIYFAQKCFSSVLKACDVYAPRPLQFQGSDLYNFLSTAAGDFMHPGWLVPRPAAPTGDIAQCN